MHRNQFVAMLAIAAAAGALAASGCVSAAAKPPATAAAASTRAAAATGGKDLEDHNTFASIARRVKNGKAYKKRDDWIYSADRFMEVARGLLKQRNSSVRRGLILLGGIWIGLATWAMYAEGAGQKASPERGRATAGGDRACSARKSPPPDLTTCL